MKGKKDKTFILLQLKGNFIKALRWKEHSNFRKEVEDFAVEEHLNLNDKEAIREKIGTVLKKIKYAGEKTVLAISHQKVSCRYLRLPSQNKKEIEEILHLQVDKILPYSPQDFIMGYQIVDTDKEGYTWINLTLAHKESVCVLIDIITKEFSVNLDSVFLTIYGIAGLFTMAKPGETGEVSIVDIEFPDVEIAILNKGKICLSRFVKVSKQEESWKNKLFKQIMDTQGIYLRQSHQGPIKKIFLSGSKYDIEECRRFLDEKMLVPVEVLRPGPELTINRKLEAFADHLCQLSGFMFKRPAESLNLLPKNLKEMRRKTQKTKERIKVTVVLAIAVAIAIVALFKHIENKRSYIAWLDNELGTIKATAGQLEIMAKRIRTLNEKHQEKYRILDFFDAIHKATPSSVFLTEIRYDAAKEEEFVLRGFSQELNPVFAYASDLRKFAVFSQEEIKVKRASSERMGRAELINFEIAVLRKKPDATFKPAID